MANQTVLVTQLISNWGYVFLAASLTCSGNLCLKQARLQSGGLLSPFFLLALFFYGINVLAFSRALDRLPLSLAYPVFAGVGFILIAFFSHYFFQENLLPSHWIGMFLILIGLIFMAS